MLRALVAPLKMTSKRLLVSLLSSAPKSSANKIINLIHKIRPEITVILFRRITASKRSLLNFPGISTFKLLNTECLNKYIKIQLKRGDWEILKIPKAYEISTGGEMRVWSRAINLYEFKNASFTPYSDFIRLGSSVYWDKADRFQLVKTIPADADLVLNDTASDAFYLKTDIKKRRLGTVFSLCGVHANSWGHFVANFIPKISCLSTLANEENLTIALPSNVDNHIKEFARICIKTHGDFKITLVNPHELIECDKLYYCTAPSFIADHALYIQPTDIHLTNWALDKVYASSNPCKLNVKSEGRKLFIGRRGARNLENFSEVENFFIQNGYEIIFPHKVSFPDKIRLFSQATHICGPYSSGFTNIIFCNPGTKVLAFCNYSRLLDGYITAFDGGQFGFDVSMLTGTENLSSDPHNSYSIPLDRIENAARILGFI